MSTRGNAIIQYENVTALILAAGEGVRLGKLPKAFLEWQEKTLLQHAVERALPFSRQIIVGVREENLNESRKICSHSLKTVEIIAGGVTRLETLERLMEQVKSGVTLVHEVARPFASAELFERVLSAAQKSEIVVPVVKVPVRDGIGLQNGDKLELQLPREQLVALQIPQAFRTEILRDILYRVRVENLQADSLPGLALAAGYPVNVVEGCARNVKITYEDDLKLLAE